MQKHKKIIIFLLLLNVSSVALVVYRYERILSGLNEDGTQITSVQGGTKVKVYTAEEIKSLIKGSKEYIGDSIIIYESGELSTNNSKFQGTLNAVTGSKDNMELVKAGIANNKLPIQYNIYIVAASFYRDQYKMEFAK